MSIRCPAPRAIRASVQDRLSPAQLTVRGMEFMRATLEGGITAVRDCGGKDYIEFAIRDAYNQGRFLGPTMRCAGRMICMTGGHGNRTGRVADGIDEVVKAVREQVHAGSDLVKIMATGGVMTAGVNPEDAHYSPEEMKAGISEAHRFHKCCASHAQGALGILNAVRGGIDSIEHGIFLTDECVKEMKERGVWLVPTLAAVKNILKGYDDGDRSIPDYVIEKSRRVFDRHIASIKMYYKAGGRIAMGTDAGTPHNRHGENARELEFMCEIGVSTRNSLFFSTASAADLMRLSDQGRIREGNVGRLRAVRWRSARRHQARGAQGEPQAGGEARPGRQGPSRRLRQRGAAGRGGVAPEASRPAGVGGGRGRSPDDPVRDRVGRRHADRRPRGAGAQRKRAGREPAPRRRDRRAAPADRAGRRRRRPPQEAAAEAAPVPELPPPVPRSSGPVAAELPPPFEPAAPPPPVPAFELPPPSSAGLFAAGWEQRLGSRAFIWVGAVTLALAAIFLVRHSIEEGYLSPEVRVILAALFGFGLIGGAEKHEIARRAGGAGAGRGRSRRALRRAVRRGRALRDDLPGRGAAAARWR